MKPEWTCASCREAPDHPGDSLMLRLYLFIKKADAILFWGGFMVAFMIGGWAGVAWWMLALIVGYLCCAAMLVSRQMKRDRLERERYERELPKEKQS